MSLNHLRCTCHPATKGENAAGLVGWGGWGGGAVHRQERGLSEGDTSDEKEAAAGVQEEGQQVESPEYKNPVGLEEQRPCGQSQRVMERLVGRGLRREAVRGS